MPSYFQIATGAGILYIVYHALHYLYWQFTVRASQRRFAIEHGCKPAKKLPSIDPFFGIDLFLRNRQALAEHRILASTMEKFEVLGVNTFAINLMNQNVWMTKEPENLKNIQSLKFKQFQLGARRKSTFIPFFGKGIFTTDGPEWQHSREMLRPNFVRSQIGDLETFDRHVSHLIQAIPKDGSMVNLQDLFFRLTIDSATEFLFGESTNCLAPGASIESATKFAEAFTRGQENIANQGRWGFLRIFLPAPKSDADTKYVHDFVDAFVDKGLTQSKSPDTEKGDGRYIFLHELIKQTRNKVEIRSELLNILLAGRDTTASLLSNVWWTLSKEPRIFANLQKEVNELGGEKPTYQQIKDMKYLRAILNESLRLYPVVPTNARDAVDDTYLPLGGGPDGKSPLFVPKGGVVAWSLFAMHRRKDYYGEDAEEFRPERWETLRPGWEYLPFNGGPRICLGQQFALTEASYTTIRLMQEFKEIESRDPEPWKEWLTLTCTGLNGAKVVLTPA